MLPSEFLTRMQAQLGPEYADFLASYEQSPDVGLRVNTLKLSLEDFLALASEFLPAGTVSPIPWCPAGVVVSSEERPGKPQPPHIRSESNPPDLHTCTLFFHRLL